jgi:hypothetical protein
MEWSWDELPVSLDKLDDHLKALLRLKIREFVHLSPWFKDVDPLVPSAKAATKPAIRTMTMRRHHDSQCPNRKLDGRVGRRYVRNSSVATRVL